MTAPRNSHDAIGQFCAVAEARGLRLPDDLLTDGVLHRCDVEGGKGKRDGAYLLHLDGIPAGGLQNWRDGLGWQDWCADVGRRLTQAEEAAHRTRIEATKKARADDERARRSKACRRAESLWKDARPADDDHPYLRAKGVRAHDVRIGTWRKYARDTAGKWLDTQIPGTLLIPMRDADGVLRSLQAIYPEPFEGRNKDFLPGGQTAGCFHVIGQVTDGMPLCICEGYATGATIHEVTGWPVAVAFDCGKLAAVARALRAKYPALPLIVAGDDDRDNPNNPGRTHAEAAARDAKAAVVFPEFAA
jgi:putative DNA primase/helicase